MNKRVQILFVCLLTSIFSVIILFKLSRVPNAYSNGFKRIFIDSLEVIPTHFYDLKFFNGYIAGEKSKRLYVGSSDYSDRIFLSNEDLTVLDTIHIPDKKILQSPSNLYGVTESNIYLVNRDLAIVSTFDFTSGKAVYKTQERIPDIPLTKPEYISSQSIIYKTSDSILRKSVFEKWFLFEPAKRVRKDLLEKQLDGFFCTEGNLSYDEQTHTVLFTYYYRNQFLAMDTNLNLLYRARTIDTTTTAKLKITHMASLDFYTLAEPPVAINEIICTGGGMLIVRSGLLADNEDRLTFGKSSVIDVYKISNGKYMFSFHIVDFDRFKVSDFRFLGDRILAIQGHYMVYYPFRMPGLK